MKVLLIDALYGEGSTGIIAAKTSSYIIRNGGDSLVCFALGQKRKEAFKFTLGFEVYLHALMGRITGYFCKFSPISTAKLIRKIKLFNPDIVHIHDPKPYYLNLNKLLSYLASNNIHTVITLHSEFFYTGKCGHSFDCEKWKTGCFSCPQLDKYPKSLFFDKTKRMYEEKKKCFSLIKSLNIICPSEWLATRAKASIFKNNNVSVINNGVDTEVFFYKNSPGFRKKYDIKDGKKIVLTVAPHVFSAEKGGEWVRKMAQSYNDEDLFYIIIGAEREEVCQNLHVLPAIKSPSLLAEFYSMADVFMLCSKRETFSMTCAEALCCGTPVVGFKSGAPETIFSGSYGHFVEYGDLDSLHIALLDMLKMIDHQGCNKKNRSKLLSKQYGQERMSENYYNLYRRIANLEDN